MSAPTPTQSRKRCLDCRRSFVGGRFARWGLCCRWRHRGRKKKYVWTAERDAILREHYDPRIRGRAQEIADRLGFPRYAVVSHAAALGLSLLQVDRRAWTEEEERFLRRHVGSRTARWLCRRLKRSMSSVIMKLKHLRISRRIDDGYTLRDLEHCFGVDHHVIDRWIRHEQLVGERRHGGRAAAYALDAWHFTDADLMRFIREHPAAFDLRRVDQEWFLGLVLDPRRLSAASRAA